MKTLTLFSAIFLSLTSMANTRIGSGTAERDSDALPVMFNSEGLQSEMNEGDSWLITSAECFLSVGLDNIFNKVVLQPSYQATGALKPNLNLGSGWRAGFFVPGSMSRSKSVYVDGKRSHPGKFFRQTSQGVIVRKAVAEQLLLEIWFQKGDEKNEQNIVLEGDISTNQLKASTNDRRFLIPQLSGGPKMSHGYYLHCTIQKEHTNFDTTY